MRVTFGTKYNQMDYYQNSMQNKLNNTNTKIASGQKIKYGYEDSSIFNQNLKLEYDIHKLNQSIDIASDANTHTLHNDKALSDISKSLDDFKVKLIHAANDVHSQTSREAIANDLQSIRNHILSVANTSIGGEYIFSGSRVQIKPFNDNGKYNGNDEKLETLIAPDLKTPYNITGNELFLSRDLDKNKIITTNIKQLNQSKLHPNIMDKINKTKLGEEVFINEDDTLRDLVGDDDDDTTNDDKIFFYIRGKKPDGTSFKSKFSLDASYSNKENATKIKDLLLKIGEAYGNTSNNEVVNVKLNEWGQIEINEIQNGIGNIEFNLLAANIDVDDINLLHQVGAKVINFNKSPYLSDFSLSRVVGIKDNYDRRYTSLPVEFISKDNKYATKETMLSDIFGIEATKIAINGKYPNNSNGSINDLNIKEFSIDIANNNVNDLLKSIESHFGGNIRAEISNGKINIIDYNVHSKENDEKEPPFNGDSGLEIIIKTTDDNGIEKSAIRNGYKSNYDKAAFLNNGSSLISNVHQINSTDNTLAKYDTKLSEVAANSIKNGQYIMKVKDHNGIDVEAMIDFSENGSYLILPNKNYKGGNYRIPFYNPHDRPPQISITDSNDITYKQLLDAISITMNYSNLQEEDLKNAQGSSNSNVTQAGKEAWENILKQSKGNVEAIIDDEGKIEIKDKVRSVTKMSFMFYNKNSDDFSNEALTKGESYIILNANNALTVDKPYISFFKQLDSMIDAVKKGIYRPDSLDENYNTDLRNIGIQNSITLFDHLKDHIEKNIALNGSYGRLFTNTIQRNEALKVQVEALKGDTIGTDIAETYNKFSQLTNNYNAILASTSKINQMSLVDFLR